MDLEVVGRHALLFDDDTMAAFVNSSKALVEWNSLLIDRYDVRHLLPGPLPPRLKRRLFHQLDAAASSLEADLDQERFLDLPSPSSDEQGGEQGNALEPTNSGGYNAVAFSYGNPEESAERKDHDSESDFHPHFPVPESLCSNLPPNEKVHQIIARTAMFVSKNGGQSEIILRVKQGDNPTFGFLMPDHHLHPYFRFLVDHQEVLEPDTDKNRSQDTGQTGGALSLLGFAYGSGEDDDGATEDTTDSNKNQSEETPISTSTSQGLGHADSSLDANKKDGGISKSPTLPLKEKVPVIKRNHSISSVKTKSTAGTKKGDSLDSLSNLADKLQTSLSSTANIDLPILEPTSEMKRAIEKVVEFILKNGREFEAILAEQDRAHGRFPFLLSSNPYHGYYLQVLQNAQESKLPGKGSLLEKHGPVGRTGDKKSVVHKENDNRSFGSMGSDIPYDIERKEKFKMVIGKSKKDGQEATSRDTQPQVGVSVDAAAAVAILQAATRGIRNPSLEIFTKTSSGNGEGPGSDGGHLSSLSLRSSQPESSVYKPKQNTEASVSVPVAKIIAQTAAVVAAGEADSSEASMTKEQKLKAERLKRAKMFAAMIKGGAAPLKSEPLRGLSVEPPGSGISGSGAETGNLAGKEREGSSVPFDAGNSDKSHKSEEKISADNDEQRAKRRYLSRSRRHEQGEEEEEEGEEKGEDKRGHKHSRKKHPSHRTRSKRHEDDGDGEEEEKGEDKRDRKHSRKKHRSHRTRSKRHEDDGEEEEEEKGKDKRDRKHFKKKHRSYGSSHSSPDRHKHKRRHSSSKDMDSTKRTKHDCSSDDEHRHKYDSSSDKKHYSSRHHDRESSLSENESRHSRRRHKHYSSSDDEHRHQRRSREHESRSHAVRETDQGEGEIIKKSDQSKTSQGEGASREASIELSKSNASARAPSQPSEATEVSDDLRAKIRAMLMATL